MRCYVELLLRGTAAHITEKIKLVSIDVGDQRNPVSEARAETIRACHR